MPVHIDAWTVLSDHMNFAHYSPVKQGPASRVNQWPYSAFNGWVRTGVYGSDWGGEGTQDSVTGE